MDEQTPRDGETLGAFEYRAYFQAWVYMAGYNDPQLCRRRADALQAGHGVPVVVYFMPDGQYYACIDWRHTSALRASMTPPSTPIWPDDEAAHVAETVDELHAAPAYRISATNLADAIERDAEAVDLDDEGEE